MNVLVKMFFGASIFFHSVVLTHLNSPVYLSNPKKDWVTFFKLMNSHFSIDTFIESGTYLGETTNQARECFEEVHTIEIMPEYYEKAKELFENTNVTVHLGNSAEILPKILPNLTRKKRKMLFWLDGHFMSAMGESDQDFECDYTPITQELKAIKQAETSNSIILIDDIRLFGTQLNNERLELAGKSGYPMLSSVVNYLKTCGFESVVFGDILFSYNTSDHVPFSDVVQACTISRLYTGSNYQIEHVLLAEKQIAQTQGAEKEALVQLYKDFSMYWRSWRNKSPHYNLWYGLILQHEKRHKEAIVQFKEVIDLGYIHWRVFSYLAESYLELNDFAGAEAALTKVLKLNSALTFTNTILKDIKQKS